MQITPIGYTPAVKDLTLGQSSRATSTPDKGFGDMLGDLINNVNGLQSKADNLAVQLSTGGDVDLHDAVLATEEASLAFQYTLGIRNKLIEAYQEVMRMQV